MKSFKKLIRENLLFFFALATTPLFLFQPKLLLVSIFVLLLLLLEIALVKKPKLPLWLILLASFPLVIVATLYSNEFLSWPFHFDLERFFWTKDIFAQRLIDQQKQAHYLSWRLRPLLLGSLIYLRQYLKNIVYFLSPNNFFEALAPLGSILFFSGLYQALKKPRKKIHLFVLLLFSTNLLCLGLFSSVDRFNGFYPASPMIALFLFLGLKKIDRRITIPLLLLNLIFLLTP